MLFLLSNVRRTKMKGMKGSNRASTVISLLCQVERGATDKTAVGEFVLRCCAGGYLPLYTQGCCCESYLFTELSLARS